jgi:hypothetical protein
MTPRIAAGTLFGGPGQTGNGSGTMTVGVLGTEPVLIAGRT